MRARWFALVVVTLGAVGALLPSPVSAGGGWISPARSTYVPAQVAVAQGTFWDTPGEETIEDGPFMAYLLPASRWIDGREVQTAGIRVGEVAITRMHGRAFRVRVEFRVPDLPAGLYHIQFCNDPCTVHVIGDLLGSEVFAIGATRTEGRLLLQAQRLRWRIDEVADRLRRETAAEVRAVTRQLWAAEDLRMAAEVRVRELSETLAGTRQALEAERSTAATAFVIAGCLLLLAIAVSVLLVVTMKRLRAARLDVELQAMTNAPAPADA
jgi:hypothetical protein